MRRVGCAREHLPSDAPHKVVRKPDGLLQRARIHRSNLTDAETWKWRVLRGGKLGGHRFRPQRAIGPFFADVYCHNAALDVGVDGPILDAITVTERGIRNHASVLTRIRQALEARYLQHPVCNITLATGNIVPPLPLRPAGAGACG